MRKRKRKFDHKAKSEDVGSAGLSKSWRECVAKVIVAGDGGKSDGIDAY